MRDESKAIEWLKRVIREKTILGEETKVANIIKEILWEEAGIKSTLVPLDGDENRCNLVAEIKGNKPGPVLAFAGHMDVVPLGEGAWDVEDPFGAEEVNGRIYGRGSSDMKAGLMASVVAMINLKNSGADFSGGLKLFATAGEESGLLGSKQLREQKYADDVDAMIVGEPTQGITFAGHKGVLRIKITTDIEIPEGEKPEPGKNAINYMLKFLENYDKEFKLSDFIVEDPTDRLSLNININPPTNAL